jgi:CRISPR/Cas system CSM-associated protein Csm2 small subunit
MTQKILRAEEFLHLPENEQVDLLHADGVHIGKRKIKRQTVILFQLYSFYVEVYYRQYRKIIERLLTSESTDILQPYLDQINIHDLNGGKKESD